MASTKREHEPRLVAQSDPDEREVREHVDRGAAVLVRDWKRKYLSGQRRHGGRPWEKPALGSLYEEILDIISYYQAHAEQIVDLRERLIGYAERLTDDGVGALDKAVGLALFGIVQDHPALRDLRPGEDLERIRP